MSDHANATIGDPASSARYDQQQEPAPPDDPSEVLWLAHALTRYPCRMADGRPGQVAVLNVDGEWTLVCKVTTPPAP